ncbi:MAG: TetR/AcrR family transcriptional regulator [Chloroflexota bacterium]
MQSFHAKGYAATTVADIVAGTRYSPGAFYHHFENKDDCFWHVIAFRERLRGDWSMLAVEFDPAVTSLNQLLERAFAHFAAALVGVTDWILVMVEFRQQHRGEPEVLAKVAETYQRWRDETARFVDALHVNGWIEPPRDRAVLAEQVFAYTEGFTVHAAMYGPSENPRVTQRALIGGLVSLLRNA